MDEVVPLFRCPVSVLDILLPPLLIALSLVLYDLTHPQSHASHRGYIFRNTTHHARFLPARSRHQFHYTLLQLALDLDQLERTQLDIPYLFRFIKRGPASWFLPKPLCSVSPQDYLYELSPQPDPTQPATRLPRSIKAALLAELRENHAVDVEKQIGSVYLLTMPSYLGLSPMNPLSVYFCYLPSTSTLKQDHPALSVVVLEVHNTFSERHLYVLQVGIDQAIKPQTGSAIPFFPNYNYKHLTCFVVIKKNIFF